MNQTERIYKLTLLLEESPKSSQALREAIEVSPATFKRDIEYMRERLLMPIVYDRSMGAYRLDQSDTNHSRYALPGLWFSADEIHALLTAAHLLGQIEPGGILERHIQPLMERLNRLLDSTDDSAEGIRQRVRIIGLGKRKLKFESFQSIGSALLARKRLRITYHARGSGEITEREISPQRLVHYRENWHLDAWCHLRKNLRNFAVDAITRIDILDRPAKEVPAQTLDAAFGPGYGIFAGKKVIWATLKFSPMRARWVAQEQWHPQQKSHFDDSGHYLLEIPYSDHRELVMDILKYGNECEVLEPDKLRKQMTQEIGKMREKYFS